MKKIIFLLLTAFAYQQAASQYIDPHFNNGTGTVNISGFRAQAVARSGKTIIVGGAVGTNDVKIYFYSENGVLHTGMGLNGISTINLPSSSLSVTGIAIDPTSKKTYISGNRTVSSITDGFIICLSPLGVLNTSFSSDGMLDFTSMPGSQNIHDIGVQSTGRVIAAGDSASKYSVFAFLSTGAFDNTFSGDGRYVATTSVIPVSGNIAKIDINSTNEIYAAGGYTGTMSSYGLTLDANGNLIKAYPLNLSYNNTAGIKYYNGKIFIASTYPFGTRTVKISCFLPDGSYDTNFNGTGSISPATGYSDNLTSLLIDKEGRIVASGWSSVGSASPQYSVMRVNIDGTLDSWMGYAVVSGSPVYESTGSVLASDGRLIMIGTNSAAPFNGNITKASIKAEYYPTWPLFSTVKYFGSDAFALPDFSNGDSKISYASNNLSKASISYGRIVTIRDTGVVGIRARIPEDSFYYAFDSIDYLRIEPKAPAIITGKKIIPEGVGTVVEYHILPDTFPSGEWSFTEMTGSRGGIHHYQLGSTNPDSVSYYFDEGFLGGTVTYRYYNQAGEQIVIESNVIARPRSEGSADIRQDVECTQELVSCAGNFIEHFRLNTLANDSSGCGNGGYHDFTASGKTTHMFLGEIYTAKIKTTTHTTSPAYIGMWIDYNNNGDFSDPEDYIISDFADPSNFKSIKMSIRNDKSYAGSRRLRVRYRTTPIHSTDACQLDGESGETEDYLVILKEQESLQGPNVVTPNEDGKNDYLTIRGINSKFSNKHLVIFDRLGDVKYSNENYDNDWAGKNSKGELLSKGTYYYVFTNGESSVKGFFELMY